MLLTSTILSEFSLIIIKLTNKSTKICIKVGTYNKKQNGKYIWYKIDNDI